MFEILLRGFDQEEDALTLLHGVGEFHRVVKMLAVTAEQPGLTMEKFGQELVLTSVCTVNVDLLCGGGRRGLGWGCH